jgi:hypothetical protein
MKRMGVSIGNGDRAVESGCPCIGGRDRDRRVFLPVTAHATLRVTISRLISPIALAGFSPFGQVRVQFMIVWQR